jgi:hypothetical protein
VSVPVTDPAHRPNRSFEGPQHAPFPGYVQTDAQRDRWSVCAAICAHVSELFEPSGRPDPGFVWTGTRALYRTDIPTGDPDPDAPVPGDWHGPVLRQLGVAES